MNTADTDSDIHSPKASSGATTGTGSAQGSGKCHSARMVRHSRSRPVSSTTL